MIYHTAIADQDLRRLIRRRQIKFGGNRKLRIYGLLRCTSGKQIKKENRAFFATEHEATKNGYRPCGHCMRAAYQQWKNGII